MPGSYADNAAALWTGLGPDHTEVLHDAPEAVVLRIPRRGLVRTVLRDPLEELPGTVRGILDAGGPRVVEDPFGALGDAWTTGAETADLTVMARPPAPVRPAPPKADLEIVRVADRRALEEAESTIVYGFPYRDLWPYTPGLLLPPEALDAPGLRVWLARRQRVPAAACCTYDDGATVGVYWVATLPEQRGRGIARAVLAAALADHQDREVVLTATPAGVPLYADLGFGEVSGARWHSWR
ncbi:GNAT family N-acetyltransferase [Actinorugispora endophytica]|uniref:Acetyltransferase (GNAT) family protein n=1 Tax=Actinorugispora endophytica TaxID=1605990 RepID=A0A4R6UHY7_9ACTN|nr:GNAT family N-acetyltransferase [Actinorugispora endophytica]TDQ45646.1 acetyltransferase (GNAT) family protein [Actinorugispora endophytica]